MAGVPVQQGRDVLFHSGLGATINPAKVIQIPTIKLGGYPNEIEPGVPEYVDILVFSMSGVFPIYRVRHKSFGDERYWDYPVIV